MVTFRQAVVSLTQLTRLHQFARESVLLRNPVPDHADRANLYPTRAVVLPGNDLVFAGKPWYSALGGFSALGVLNTHALPDV